MLSTQAVEAEVSETKIPKVDLLDIEREPTDQELEAIMQAMTESATIKWESAWSKYTTDLVAGIKEAARIGARSAKILRSQREAPSATRAVLER